MSDLSARLEALVTRLRRRLVLRSWFDTLHRSAVPFFVPAALGFVLLSAASALPVQPVQAAPVFVAAWLLTAAGVAWLRGPRGQRAVAIYDRAARNGELFLSACSLVRQRDPGPGTRLHLARARAHVDAAVIDVPAALPLPRVRAALLTPVFFVAAALLLPTTSGNPIADASSREAAGAPESTDRPDLEGRAARAVERLAAMDARTDVSPRLLDALSRHADTARLAGALRREDLEEAASELDNLTKRLRTPGLSEGARRRVRRALEDGVAQTEPGDSDFARRADEARRALEAGRPGAAADALDALARDLRHRAGRMRSARALGSIAESLRSGSGEDSLLDARARSEAVRGSARAGVGTAPYEPAAGSPLEARRDEHVRPRTAASEPGTRPRTGADPIRPASPPGALRVRFDEVPERGLPDASIPAPLRATVQRYFASLRARAP